MSSAAIVVREREIRAQARSGSSSGRSGSGPRRSCIACFSPSVISAQVGGAAQVDVRRRRCAAAAGRCPWAGGRGPGRRSTLPKRPRWMWIQPRRRRSRRKRCLPWASAVSSGVPVEEGRGVGELALGAADAGRCAAAEVGQAVLGQAVDRVPLGHGCLRRFGGWVGGGSGCVSAAGRWASRAVPAPLKQGLARAFRPAAHRPALATSRSRARGGQPTAAGGGPGSGAARRSSRTRASMSMRRV